MAEMKPTQIRIDDDRIAAIAYTAKYVGLKGPDTHRKALDLGLPALRKLMGRKKK